MINIKYKRITIIGDDYGIPELVKIVPHKNIVCIIGASIRPQYIGKLEDIGKKLKVPLLIQPKFNSLDYINFYNSFKETYSDMLICHSYSMIIRKDILKNVEYNAINIHSALLPKNRGPNPIQWAIIKDEKKTGVTMHYMNDEIDSGDIYAQLEVSIDMNDTWVNLRDKMDNLSKRLLANEIPKLLNGDRKRIKQDEKDATTNFRLTPVFPKIDFHKMSDGEVYNLIRAQVAPLHGAYIEQNGERMYFPEEVPMEKIKELRLMVIGN